MNHRLTDNRVRLLFYGDDFTGASDNAAQYARHGLRTRLFFTLPTQQALEQAARECDVIGVAGTARSLDVQGMTQELLPVLQAFAKLQVPLFQYKCCSTFDSSQHSGSLGYAIALMRQVWPDCFVPVHAAAPEFGRYTVFGHHFARAGQQIYRLDQHPVMSVHPATPMHESKLSAVLSEQGFTVEKEVDLRELDQFALGASSLADKLNQHDSVVFDGYTQQHVVTTAAVLHHISQQRQVCAMAAQGLAHGWGHYWQDNALTTQEPPQQQLPATDRVLVLSGSCSALSALQIAHAKECSFLCLRLTPELLFDDQHAGLDLVIDQTLLALKKSQSVVVFTAQGPQDPHTHSLRDWTREWPAGQLAQRIGSVFARIAAEAFKQTSLTRLVVAGGDSSSFTMRALGAQGLQCKASHFAQNAHFASMVSDEAHIHGKEILLKGGQVGAENLYTLALNGFGH
jgi:uncharacterized protein YgbK (DUF1537 family)